MDLITLCNVPTASLYYMTAVERYQRCISTCYGMEDVYVCDRHQCIIHQVVVVYMYDLHSYLPRNLAALLPHGGSYETYVFQERQVRMER